MKPRPDRVVKLLERDERTVTNMAVMRARRLAKFIDLTGPDWIIAAELRMVNEAVEALFKHRSYDPSTDERLHLEEP